MKPMGLGRGLDAIFETGAGAKVRPMSEVAGIAVSSIFPNPKQPRRAFHPEALDELAASIRALGVIQPVTVKPAGEGRYMLISGERRWRAAQLAGLDALPAYVREVDDEDLHAMALVENLQREELNPIEVALGLQRLVDECGLSQAGLSEKVGKKRSTVANFLRLLTLPDEVQLALKQGLISAGHAKAIAGTSQERQLPLLHKTLQKGLSVRQTELAAHAWEPAPKAAPEPKAPEKEPANGPSSTLYERLREALDRHLSARRIGIRPTAGDGARVTIELADQSDVERLIRELSR